MNDFLLRLKRVFLKYKEWLVVIIMLAAAGYLLFMYRSLTEEQVREEVLGGENQRGPQDQEELQIEEIVETIEQSPEDYAQLVIKNPFMSIDAKIQKKEWLEERFRRAQEEFESGNYMAAKELFQEVLERDTFEAYVDYKPYSPSRYIELCERRNLEQSILSQYEQGLQRYQEFVEKQDEEANKNELLRLVSEAKKLFETVVEKGREILPDVVEGAQARLEGREDYVNLNQRYNELRDETLVDNLNRLYDLAMEYWNRRDEAPTFLADAYESLQEAQDLIADGEVPPDGQDAVENISELEEEVLAEIDERYPRLLERAEQLRAESLDQLEPMREALEIYDVLYRFRQEEDIQQELRQVQEQVTELENQRTLEQAGQWVQQAENMLTELKRVYARRQWDRLAEMRNEIINLMDRVDSITKELPELRPIQQRAAEVREELEELKPPPAIEGLTLLSIDPQIRVAKIEYDEDRPPRSLYLGQSDPVLDIRFESIGQRDEEGNIESIIVSRAGHRDTELFVTEE